MATIASSGNTGLPASADARTLRSIIRRSMRVLVDRAVPD